MVGRERIRSIHVPLGTFRAKAMIEFACGNIK
jgi:hypothetical protein